MIRNGVPVSWCDALGHRRDARARVIDFDNEPGANRFLAVRELKLQGMGPTEVAKALKIGRASVYRVLDTA